MMMTESKDYVRPLLQLETVRSVLVIRSDNVSTEHILLRRYEV